MEYVLRTDKLTKCFGDKKAVNIVSMQIKKGDIYGFIGKNGAGKTMLMRLVLGVAEPSDGRITLLTVSRLVTPAITSVLCLNTPVYTKLHRL